MRRLSAILCLVFACGGSSRPCEENADCPTPLTCVAGRCAASGSCIGASSCNSDEQCTQGQHCANGCCANGEVGSCARDSDCSAHPEAPVCDTGKGTCVQCLASRDCGAGSLCKAQHCEAQPGCASDTDCHDPSLPVCDLFQNACVECEQSTDCKNPSLPNCDATHHCSAAQQCTTDANCAQPTSRCLLPAGRCVACLSAGDCTAPMTCDPVQNSCVDPAATTCTAENDCSSNSAAPHCKPGANGAAGTCVACVADAQCQAGQVCTAQNTCAVKTCNGDGDCAAPVPRCDTSAKACVACLVSADCPNGGTCGADHTCTAAGRCTGDKDCAQSVTDPKCDTVSGNCVECLAAADCGAGKTCTAQHTCVSSTCKADTDCSALPATPFCNTANGSCVRCNTAAQCGSGYVCSANACKPVCTAGTQAADCATATPFCREQPFPQCVQCLQTAQCPSGQVCSTANTCVTSTSCQTSGTCPANAPVCDPTAHTCVQCLAQADCKNGMGCDTAAHTCTLSGGEGQVCKTGGTCNTGLLCMNEGGANGPVCRTQCNPYAPSCAAGRTCSWLEFDVSGTFIGDCAPLNGHAGAGAACDPRVADACEWNLVCAPSTASTGTCQPVCDPTKTSTCASGVCNAIIGNVSDAGALQKFGVCGPATKWGQACTTDSAAAGPDCGSALSATATATSLYCTPSYLPADPDQANILTVCQPTYYKGAGGAADSCAAGDSVCRTGVCLTDGPATCFSGCAANADCGRDGAGSTTYCFDVDFLTAEKDNVLASCEPTCRNESDCVIPGSTFGRTCAPTPTHPGSSWRAVCAPVSGSGKAGAKCTGSSDCASGVCITGRTLEAIELGQSVTMTPTDGFCLGSCVSNTDCTVAGTVCSTGTAPVQTALPLFPLNGTEGVMGVPSPGICWPQTCTRDAQCAGLSADANAPRVCAPYKKTSSASTDSYNCSADADCTSRGLTTCNTAANNPNPGGAYGTSAGIYGPNGKCRQVTWALHCAPSLGGTTGGAGAACTFANDCGSGHCIVSGTSSYCFGGCATDADCKNNTHCKAGSYLGLTSALYCQP